MKKAKCLLLIPLIFTLSSCVGEEPNDIAYVTELGIDKAESGYLYTIQFAKPNKISGGSSEEGGSGGDIVENISIEAPTIYSAINNANSIVSKNFSMSHAKIIVVSEETAKEGLNGINDTLSRNDEIRPGVYIAIAENAGEYLEEVKPVIEVNPSKYYQLTYENNNESSIPKNTALDFYFACISGDEDCVLPLAGVAESDEKSETTNEKSGSGGEEDKSITNKSQQEAEKNEGGFESGTNNKLAGQAGVTITNKSEAMGIAIFKEDKYIEKMGSTEAEIYNMLVGKFRDDYLTFYADSTPEIPITVKTEERVKPKYKINKEKKEIDIYIRLICELQSVSEKYRAERSIEQIEESISQMTDERLENFVKTLYGELGADVLGIKGKLKSRFLTIDEYEEYCKSFKPEEWKFNIHTEIKMLRTGMTYYN